MLAWIIDEPGPIDSHPIKMTEKDIPPPKAGQVLLKILACGVCRTDLHLAEGDLPPQHKGIVPGHEIVGTVESIGPGCNRFQIGDRVGIAWLRNTCGECSYCAEGMENLCISPSFTGWTEDGGFAQYAVVNETYAYQIPDGITIETAAPLLCSGIIGYRALKRANVPPNGRLGIYGFGASAHLTLQVALSLGFEVHVITRSKAAQHLALEMGAKSASGIDQPGHHILDSAILYAPSGNMVPIIMESLDRGGTLAIAGIHLSDIPAIDYNTKLFNEKTLTSVTSNTRSDGNEFLELASNIGIRVVTSEYPFIDANKALVDLAHGKFTGAAVLKM